MQRQSLVFKISVSKVLDEAQVYVEGFTESSVQISGMEGSMSDILESGKSSECVTCAVDLLCICSVCTGALNKPRY